MWIGVAGAAVVSGLLVHFIASSLGTSLTRDDFETEAEARDFVSGHLPTRLPSGAAVRVLTYERFTDWHLAATVTLATPEEMTTYVAAVTRDRVTDEYCGPPDAGEGVSYFLKQWSACGVVALGEKPSEVIVRCNTR